MLKIVGSRTGDVCSWNRASTAQPGVRAGRRKSTAPLNFTLTLDLASMRSRTKKFIQHLSHDIEDEDRAEEYLDESLPLIGLIVMYFNSLEKSLDSLICEVISDRTDAPGLIVIQKLMYVAKVDLFKRFSDDFHGSFYFTPVEFNELIGELIEVGKLRNLVVHADWSSTDEDGYTFVRLKTSSNGMLQEYVQFSVESLEKLIERLIKANHRLSDYWKWKSERLQYHLQGAS
ncbi:MAG TPA: hypothetical protein PLL61_13380 [Thiobacillus sp.]|nr:hypothetical protein [Thiobacillus sp.]